MATINENLAWLKTLKQRHSELQALRNTNTTVRTTRYDNRADEVVQPLYDLKHLDRQVARLASEIRKLDAAIKAVNAVTEVPNYVQDETVLGTLE